MTTTYVLIFLTLFAIIGDIFVQKYLHHKINDSFSLPHYETYVHRRRPHMNQGLNMRSLVTQDPHYCEIFEGLIRYVYEKAPFFYEELGQELLAFFQTNITFDHNDVLKGKHLYKEVGDLETLLIPNEKLEEAYLFLIKGSSVDNDENNGYPSLKTFFYHKDDKSLAPKLNLYDMPLKLIGAMFGEEAEQSMCHLRKTWADHAPSSQEEPHIVDHFLVTHRISAHKYHSLVNFKIRKGPTPQ